MKRNRLFPVLALTLALMIVLPLSASAATTATIQNGPANVYATGHLGSPVVAIYANGTRVQVISFDDNWAELQIGEGQTGYVITSQINFGAMPPVTPVPTTAPVTHEKVETTGANATIASANRGPVHLRSYPSFDAAVIDTYANGSRILVISQDDAWYYVKAGSDVGYMDIEFVALDSGVIIDHGEGYDAVVHNPTDEEILHLRAEPSTDSESLGEYHNGTYVRVLGIGVQWHYVMVDGKEGYMMTEYVNITTPDVTANKIVSHADADMVTVHESASDAAAAVTQLANGTMVTVLIPGPEWAYIQVSDGTGQLFGYIQSKYLAVVPGELG